MPASSKLRRGVINHVHKSPIKFVLYVTGGGSLAISDLLSVSGGSKTFLAANVPYSEQALAKLLSKPPEQACSERTARQLAMAAWKEACALSGEKGPRIIGLGCTASLASNRPKRGDHRIHLAIQTATLTMTWSVTLQKGRRTREAEERLAADAILNLLAFETHVSTLKLGLLKSEQTFTHFCQLPANWHPLLDSAPYVMYHEGSPDPNEHRAPLLFPGSFAPLHEGHREIAALAEKRTGKPVVFEIAARNVDKPPLDYIELTNRVEQFDDPTRVWLTTTPTFVEKAKLFRLATFVVGIDTITRIADPRYYGDDAEKCRAAIKSIADAGCRFLVYGRVNPAGVFQTLRACDLPIELLAICEEIPETEFRRDVSSTELRAGRGRSG